MSTTCGRSRTKTKRWAVLFGEGGMATSACMLNDDIVDKTGRIVRMAGDEQRKREGHDFFRNK